MHAAEIALGLQIPTVLIPKNAGVLSSLGLLLADSTRDYSKSVLETTDSLSSGSDLDKEFRRLEEKAMTDMQKEGFKREDIGLKRLLDLRYYGQSYEITIPYKKDCDYLDDFHKSHERLYSYSHPGRPVEIVNVRTKADGKTRKIKLTKTSEGGTDPEKAFIKKQNIYYRGKHRASPVYERSLLEPGNTIYGPALIVDYESTTFIPSEYTAGIDAYLNIVLSGKE
jgi:N-methylhydantoinase A/oxoprolinase/acetone carboxylase beta subunit